jgi:hypothetical protein
MDSASLEKCQSSTRKNIPHYCSGQFGKVVTRGWVDSFLICHKDDLAATTSKPQDEAHLQVLRGFLLGTISGIEEAVQGCIDDLVFSLDEVGVSEWEDRKSKKVILPSAMSS